jgi:hypothetical protein
MEAGSLIDRSCAIGSAKAPSALPQASVTHLVYPTELVTAQRGRGRRTPEGLCEVIQKITRWPP